MNSSEKLQYEPTIADNRNTSLKRPFYIEDTSVMFYGFYRVHQGRHTAC